MTTLTEDTSPATLVRTVCPVCNGFCEGDLQPLAGLPESLQPIVRSNAANTDAREACRRCLKIFSRAQRQIESHAAIFEQNAFVLPTPLRMDADERFTGRGVTMAFLDSGFYAHPDLTT